MAESGSLPAQPGASPGLPASSDLIVFSGWNGIDTKPPRPGVADDKCAWCDNLMPLAENDIRAIPDCAVTPFYTPPGGLTILDYDSFGLQPNGVNSGPYLALFLSDGSAVALSLTTASTTQIAPTGTFAPPTGTAVVSRQYGTKYLLMATVQSQNAYWIWDGNLLYSAGSIGPEVDISDGGSGYTGTPTITAIGGSGTGATFTSTVVGGSVATITPTNPGSGWLETDPVEVLLLFTGGGGGTSAYGMATVVDGAIVSITVVNGGSGFTGVPALVVTDAMGTGCVATVTGISGGVITAITVYQCGSGYVSPTVSTSGGGGSGLVATANIQNGVITGITMTADGSGYIEAPVPFFLSATGSGAAATAILDGGAITGLTFGISNFTGSGYTAPVIVGFQGGGGPASATALLMPFGIQGNAIEVYQQRAWIATTLDVVKIFFTAAGSAVDFNPDDGGGAFPATESVLRYQYTNLIQSNGFLYLIGDSSVNYISGVTTSGTPAITTFSNLNVDPQIGSPWNQSVQVYSRAIVMANPFGIHAIYGGAVQKISSPLDGVYNTGTIDLNNLPHSAVAELFGVLVYMLLMPITDPISGQPRNALFMWDSKRWWTASQHVPLNKIRTVEWGSTINAWGSDGTSIYQLFTTPSILTTKTLQSKLYTKPSIIVQKKAMQLYALWESTEASTLNFTIDTESRSTAVTQGPFAATSGISWARSNAGDNLGYCMGFTMTSTSPDFTLINGTLLVQQRRLTV